MEVQSVLQKIKNNNEFENINRNSKIFNQKRSQGRILSEAISSNELVGMRYICKNIKI